VFDASRGCCSLSRTHVSFFFLRSHILFPDPHTDAPSAVVIKVPLSARNSITLSFEGQQSSSSSSAGDETPISGYIINYKSHQENWEELKVTGKRSQHVLENLRCGTKYQITVTAFNGAGRSPPSALVTAATAGSGELKH
jgi:hypothetical protein